MDIEEVTHMVCPFCGYEWHALGMTECPKCGLQREAEAK